ncbi:MAG TPA: PilT/PilU family type 4a pilus ATPase [Tepidisphaeraceae bacterium]|jgi:twitching motility protein PilT|nr:PilT/PilU family type 4a pilus ATPase [Tepidisphaeraceae bacterium]
MTTDSTAKPAIPAATPAISVQERRVTLVDFCRTAIKINGSDIHLQGGAVPMIRADGKPKFLDLPPLSDDLMKEYVNEICNSQSSGAEKREILEKRGSVDLAFPMPDKSARFRTNIFHSKERYAIVMRRIVTKIPNMDDLALPPQVEQLAEVHRGIVVVSGTTGSGKSTTLASIIGRINKNRSERIITVEDPIEFQHENIKSMVSQVEVGQDSESYDYALRAMMRQDPDVILIGEIRDSFSMTTALRAADTGHLVFTTVHATNAPMTVERMVSLFLPDQKELQQTQLGLNLVAVLTQRLARRRDGKGRVPVVEIMFATPLVRKYILEGEFEKLKGCVGNRESGSQSFDQHLTELFTKQIIDVSEAKRLASNVDALNLALRGISNSDTKLR